VPSGAMNGTIELPPLNPVYSSLTRAWHSRCAGQLFKTGLA
jgi:hypothetical protein